jgi:hypothetical protein
VAAEHWARKRNAVGATREGVLFDNGTTGLAESEQLRRLVEGFAERIVYRGAKANIIGEGANMDELRVPAGDEQQEIRRRDAIGQTDRQRVRLEMVDRDERLALHERKRLRGHDTDEQATD